MYEQFSVLKSPDERSPRLPRGLKKGAPKRHKMPPKAPTTKRKKTSKAVKRRVIDPSALQQVDELLDLLTDGQAQAQFLNAQQLSEASIKLGLTIDVDLAQSMLEFSTGHEDDVEITREQFITTITRLLDDAPKAE